MLQSFERHKIRRDKFAVLLLWFERTWDEGEKRKRAA